MLQVIPVKLMELLVHRRIRAGWEFIFILSFFSPGNNFYMDTATSEEVDEVFTLNFQ